MSYVDRIVRWREGTEWQDGSGLRCEPGDYPEVRYDLSRIARDVDRDALVRGPSSLWRYADLLPIDEPEHAVTLGEGWTPVLALPRLGEGLGCPRLWAKDEGRNPSGTFKDRGASVAVTRLRELGISTVVHNSSGNAAGAWALYSARAGLRCVNLLPADVMAASLRQSTLSGADTVLFEGPWQEAGAVVAKAVEEHGWFNAGTLKEPHRLEGKKTMGLELAEQFSWRLPDAIVYPTGGGLGIIAIYKAFKELQALGWVDSGPLPKLTRHAVRGMRTDRSRLLRRGRPRRCLGRPRCSAGRAEVAGTARRPGRSRVAARNRRERCCRLLGRSHRRSCEDRAARRPPAMSRGRHHGGGSCEGSGARGRRPGREHRSDAHRLGAQVDVRAAGRQLSHRPSRSGTGAGLIPRGPPPATIRGCRTGNLSCPAPTVSNRYAPPSVPTCRYKGD